MLKNIMVLFHSDENAATESLNKLKERLTEKTAVSENACELFEVCRYNVLATINSVPVQNRKNTQLTDALMEASMEIEAICEIL